MVITDHGYYHRRYYYDLPADREDGHLTPDLIDAIGGLNQMLRIYQVSVMQYPIRILDSELEQLQPRFPIFTSHSAFSLS